MQDKNKLIVRLSLLVVFVFIVIVLIVKNTDMAGQLHEEQQSVQQIENEKESKKINSNLGEDSSKEGTVDLSRGIIGGTESHGLPTFNTPDIKVLEVANDFRIEDYYITSRYGAFNHYYIDEDKVLWATGGNEYGQLGNGSYSYEEKYEEPVKVAENVLMVDASENGYFAIYVTEAGELYGMGANYGLVLLGEDSEANTTLEYTKVPTPILLMSDVIYARAGRESIVAIKKDKSAYWWGQYAPWTHTHAGDIFNDYWKVVEDEENPVKMLATKPRKVMDNCRYITSGAFQGAAIGESGELYTWGCNIFGQCGTPVIGDDFIRNPIKVLDDVKMVWVENMQFNDPLSSPSEINWGDWDYSYNTFILKNDRTIAAAGVDIGKQEKVTEINGDLESTEVHTYSDTFIPIHVKEYSEENNRALLQELVFGMNKDEVESILNQGGLSSYWVEYDNMSYFVVENSRYYCYFDEQGALHEILLQEGGSRDNRFTMGMDLASLEEIVKREGGTLETDEKREDSLEWYVYFDDKQQIRYEFGMYEGELSCLFEKP